MTFINMLMSKAPGLAGKIVDKLEIYKTRVAKRNNDDPANWGYREFRPDDPAIGGTVNRYYASFTYNTAMHLLAQATALTVPTANAYVSFGWYCNADFGPTGYLMNKKINVEKSEYIARNVYSVKEPVPYMYLDFDHIMFGQEQDLLDFVAKNVSETGAAQVCICVPVMFRIATLSALNIEVSDSSIMLAQYP